MTAWFHKRQTCRLCNATTLECVLPMRPIPIATPNVDVAVAGNEFAGMQESAVPLDLYRCLGCGHVQLLDVIDPAVQYNNFLYTTSISLGLPEHFRKFADETLKATDLPAGGLVVEVGSNDGTLLRAFKERGMTVLGVDPARRIAERATASGVPTLPTFFTAQLAREIRLEHGPAAIVIANNTFANLDDLDDFAVALRELLAPDGVFVFETSYGADVVRKTLIDTIYHEHLSYFLATPLDAYFTRHGLDLIDIQRIWTKGGSIRGLVQRAGGPRGKSGSVAAMVADEKALGFDALTPFRALAVEVAALQAQVAALVAKRRAAGKRLAGYGASVGTVTLIQQFELGSVLDFIVDDKPLGEHLRGPGYQIPIVAPSALYERKPDTVLILAWRYADPIIAKHPNYLAEGGEFVIPLPKLVIRGS